MKTQLDLLLTKSVPTVPAHNAGLCGVNQPDTSEIEKLYFLYARNRFCNQDLRFIIELQVLNGLRITECLNITAADCLDLDTLCIRTLKGGRNRIIKIKYNKYFIQGEKKYKQTLSQRIDRFYVYRIYRKLGIYQRFNYNKHDSVTHYFRHNICKMLKDKGLDNKTISDYMGWRGDKTILYYL